MRKTLKKIKTIQVKEMTSMMMIMERTEMTPTPSRKRPS